MAGYYSPCAQRVDLLDHLRQEAGDQEAARRKGVLGAERRNAAALLLAWLPASLNPGERRRQFPLLSSIPAEREFMSALLTAILPPYGEIWTMKR
jgi:hypothetical protein